MRGPLLALCLFGFVGLPACGGSDDKPADTAAECDTELTWENFGAGFTSTWCTPCHSSSLTGGDRNGAPAEVDLETADDVRQWSNRIRVLATGDEPMMPSDGATKAGDRALLLEYLDCGAPGGTSVSTCGTLAWHTGDVALESAADAEAMCASANAVAGDVVIAGGVVVDCLCEVDGGLIVAGNDVSLPVLSKVGSLTMTGGALYVPDLQTIDGDLVVTGSLTALDLPRLVSVGGDFVVAGNTQLTSVDTYRLRTVGGDVEISGNPVLDRLTGTDTLESVGGEIRLIDNGGPATPGGFYSLDSVGGSIHISGNSGMTSLAGFSQLLASHDVEITGNPDLETLAGFQSLIDVAGGLVLSDNLLLAYIDGLVNLKTVSADLTITDNPSLSTSRAQALVDQLDSVGGVVDVSGNQP